MEVIKQQDGEYLLFTDNGREYTGINLKFWIEEVQKLGAGEILLSSVDRDGTMNGLDIELIKQSLSLTSIPIIFHGGVGSLNHTEVLIDYEISGLAIASAFHYKYLNKMKTLEDEFVEGNIDFILKEKKLNKGFTIAEVKKFLNDRGINVRNN